MGKHQSPSIAISLLALFVSLGGVGYAAATIGSAQIKNNSVRSKDIRNNDVRGRDIRSSTVRGSDVGDDSLGGVDIVEGSLARVPSASHATSATTAGSAAVATTANSAAVATTAETAGPRAYAEVQANGTVTAGLSKNITTANVAHAPNSALYCFDLPFRPKHVLTTSRTTFDAVNVASAEVSPPGESGTGDCSAQYEAEVQVYNTQTNTFEPGQFSIQFH